MLRSKFSSNEIMTQCNSLLIFNIPRRLGAFFLVVFNVTKLFDILDSQDQFFLEMLNPVVGVGPLFKTPPSLSVNSLSEVPFLFLQSSDFLQLLALSFCQFFLQ